MPGWKVEERAPWALRFWLRCGVVLVALALPAAAAPAPEEIRARKLAATGIPGLCAERFAADPARERCVEHQLEAGRRIRAILLANRGDAELEGTVERCADAASSKGAYDWVKIRDCTDLWLRNAVRERSR
jgi:hypothetical protein